ncbi:MAG: sigma-70 family RNA polymerase sigma factor, partial [Bacteroidetes bacterium]|nr:sigma-70 family RNA polymerase sigma factor [Bacteroidota bacterium]
MIFRRTDNPKKAAEAELIQGCLKKDRRYQEEFYGRYASKMLAVCSRYAKSQGEAEDILHEGFIKAFSKLNRFKGSGSLEGWVRRIMVNTALESFRKNKNLSLVEEVEDNNELKMEAKAFTNMGADEILMLIQKLPTGF